jgi:hypothetical protein
VGGIQPTCKEQDIRSALSDYCDYILKVDIKMKNNYLNRGYAFIFVTSEVIADKMTKMKFKLGDRILQIQNINKNSKEKEEYKLKRLYLKNLPPQTMDHELYQHFEPFGEVRSSYIIKDRFGQFRDYGFIDFERVEDVDKCLEALKKTPLVIKGHKIKVRRFIKLDDKKDDDDDDNPTPEVGALVHPPSTLSTKRSLVKPSPIQTPNYMEHCLPEYKPPSSQFLEEMANSNPAYPGALLPHFKYTTPPFSFKPLTYVNSSEHLINIPTMCPPTTVTSPFGFRAVPAAKKSVSDDDSFNKGHPAYPFDQTNGLKKPSQEFEEDLDFAIGRDLHSYQSDIELNHYFQNLRLNLRRLDRSSARLVGERALTHAN